MTALRGGDARRDRRAREHLFEYLFGKDALEEDVSFMDRRREISRRGAGPTVSEPRDARLRDVDATLNHKSWLRARERERREREP